MASESNEEAFFNEKPKFFLNRLPQNKPDLNQRVESPINAKFPRSNFRQRHDTTVEKCEPTRRYDRRVFVKVDEARTPDEWEQYAIRHGFTDAKFVPGILRGFGETPFVDHKPAVQFQQNCEPDLSHRVEPPINEEFPKSDFEQRLETTVKPDSSHRVEPPINEEFPRSNFGHETMNKIGLPITSSKFAPTTMAALKFESSNNEALAAAALDDDKVIATATMDVVDALFFRLAMSEFTRLDAPARLDFKRNVLKSLYGC